jgi:uncharacterized protein YkwD
MTDNRRGMEGSTHRIYKLIRAAATTALLGGVLVVAGCGSGGDNSAKPPTPVTPSSSANGGVVTADNTSGLTGSAGRATAKSQQFQDKQGEIPATANHKPKHKGGGVAAGANCPDIGVTPSDANMDAVNAAILCLVNGERTDNGGLPPLGTNSQLAQAATGMCQQMITQHFFAHETPDGKNVVDRVEPTGYIPDSGDWVVGENLAWGSGALSTPQAIVNGWMNSPGHRANILATDYKDVGLAACNGSPSTQQSGGTTYVNDFGAKSGADVNAKLPPEGGETGDAGGDSGNSAGAATTAAAATGATAAAKKAKAKAKKKAKKRKRRHRRH